MLPQAEGLEACAKWRDPALYTEKAADRLSTRLRIMNDSANQLLQKGNYEAVIRAKRIRQPLGARFAS